MAKKKSLFGIRFPWSSAPKTQTNTTGPKIKPQTPSKPTTTHSPTFTQRPPSTPQVVTPIQTNSSPRTKSQPSSSSQANTNSQNFSESSSPSSPTTQSLPTSQSSSPAQTVYQTPAASPPPSPLHTTSQPTVASQTLQSQPPSNLDFHSGNQTSKLPSSQSVTTAEVQPKEAITQIPWSRTEQATGQERFEAPAIDIKAPEPISKEEEPKLAEPNSEPKPQPETLETFDAVLNVGETKPLSASSSVVTTVPPSEEESETPSPAQKSDSFSKDTTPEPPKKLDKKIEETQQLKEVEQKTNAIAYDGAKKIVNEPVTAVMSHKAETREHPSVTLEGKRQMAKHETPDRTDKLVTPVSNGKRAKTMLKKSKSKSKKIISHQKLAILIVEEVAQHQENRNDVSKNIHKTAALYPEYPMDEKPVSIITRAGENIGASMEMDCELAKAEGTIHIQIGSEYDASVSVEATTDGGGTPQEPKLGAPRVKQYQARKAYINSNKQSINESILFNSSITERNSCG